MSARDYALRISRRGSIITAIEGASYGTGRNHGVWGAVYWAPPHITIGRW